MNIVVDKLLVNYQTAGSEKAKLVLLLHGWGDTIQGMHGLQTALAAHYRVVAIDLPGFGASEAPAGVWDLDDYARFIDAFIKKLELSQPYTVIGHSNGGALAVRAVSLGTIKPQKLVLLAASGVRTGNRVRRTLLKLIAKVGNVATLWMPERQRQSLRKSLYGVAGSDMLVVPHLQETFKRTVRQDVQHDAARLTVPTLLIYGRHDRAVPLADGQKYQRLIKGAKLEVIEDAEHFVHLDKPEAVRQLIEEFLA